MSEATKQQSNTALVILAEMWQAYANEQCGWQDAATYHGHSACDRDGREAVGRVFDEYLPSLRELLPAPSAPHFESREL